MLLLAFYPTSVSWKEHFELAALSLVAFLTLYTGKCSLWAKFKQQWKHETPSFVSDAGAFKTGVPLRVTARLHELSQVTRKVKLRSLGYVKWFPCKLECLCTRLCMRAWVFRC